MSRLLAAVRSAFYAAVFLGAWGWLALQARPIDARLGLVLPEWAPVSGVLVMTFGGAVVLACLISFVWDGKGTQAPFDPPQRFVETGPYRWVRNPMYLGAAGMLVGFGLLHRSAAILGLALLFVLFFHLFVVFHEEPRLKGSFGPSYDAYLGRVQRWVPRRPV